MRPAPLLLLPGLSCSGALGLSLRVVSCFGTAHSGPGALVARAAGAPHGAASARPKELRPLAAATGEEMEETGEVDSIDGPLVDAVQPDTAAEAHPRLQTDLWSVPNVLTMARVAAIPVFGSLFYVSPEAMPMRNVACAAIFAIASATDWLDGYLARRMNIVSPFGAFLDPVADKLMVATALVLLTERLGAWMAICTSIILCREIGVSALREWMAQVGARDAVKVGAAGKVKTAATMVALTLLLLLQPGPGCVTIISRSVWLLPAQILLCLSTVLTVTSGSGYLQAAWPALMGRLPIKKD